MPASSMCSMTPMMMAWPESDFPVGIEIREAIDIDFGRGVEEFVDEDRASAIVDASTALAM